MVYIDETGMDQFLYREHARATRGEKVYGLVSGKKYKRVSVVAGKYGGRILAPLEYSGTTDSILFEYWFENLLLKEVLDKSVIVMDNDAFHCRETLNALATKAGCSILFLPPYSPDLNPIEHFWAWLKRKLQELLPLFDNFDSALSSCFQFK